MDGKQRAEKSIGIKVGIGKAATSRPHKISQAPPGGNKLNVPPPEMEKIAAKNIVIPKALFFSTIFPKIVKIQFLLNFHQTFQNFSIFSRQFIFVVLKREKLARCS